MRMKESYPNYDVDEVYKELKRLCNKGGTAFYEFYVEKDERGFAVSISDEYSYIKLEDFVPMVSNINKSDSSFHMYYEKDNTYMTIYAFYDDEDAVNCLVEVVRLLASLGGAYAKCKDVSDEIQKQVSILK